MAQSASGSSARNGSPTPGPGRSAAARARAGSPPRRASASPASRSASSRSTSTRAPATNRQPWRSPAMASGPSTARSRLTSVARLASGSAGGRLPHRASTSTSAGTTAPRLASSSFSRVRPLRLASRWAGPHGRRQPPGTPSTCTRTLPATHPPIAVDHLCRPDLASRVPGRRRPRTAPPTASRSRPARRPQQPGRAGVVVVVDAGDLGDGEAVGWLQDDLDRVAGADLALGQDAEVGAGPAGGREPARELLGAHADAQPEAGRCAARRPRAGSPRPASARRPGR